MLHLHHPDLRGSRIGLGVSSNCDCDQSVQLGTIDVALLRLTDH